MADYLVTWTLDVFDAESHRAAAMAAYNSFCRPGSIAHVFDVSDGGTTIQVDLDLGRDTSTEGSPISYPLGDDEIKENE